MGYRRDDVRVSHEGWSLEVPGSYAERRSAEEWWGGGAGRSITLAATDDGLSADGTADVEHRRSSSSSPWSSGPDAITHRAGEVLGRARLMTDASSGSRSGSLSTDFTAVSGSGAAIRIEFDDPADWQWALSHVAVPSPRADGTAKPIGPRYPSGTLRPMGDATEAALTAAVLAETTDTTIDTVERLAAVGILHPTGDGRFVEGDRHRLRLVAAFEASGVPLEVLIAAAEDGRIRFETYDELHAELGPTSERTYGEFRAAVDQGGTRLPALFTAMGLAEPSGRARLPVEDERLLETYLELSDETGDPALATRVVRLYGEAARRTSAGTLQAYAEAVRALGARLRKGRPA